MKSERASGGSAWIATLALLLSACASSGKPCQEAGDASWPYAAPMKLNRRCEQRKNPTGQWWNHGLYQEWDSDNRLVLSGQFYEGKKQGLWTQLDPSAKPPKKILEKRFEKGEEISASVK